MHTVRGYELRDGSPLMSDYVRRTHTVRGYELRGLK